jgi:FkbM family methyltransferase
MIELGAGFGRWTARAAAAAEQRNLRYSLMAVEAEPTHFAWLKENLHDNRVDLNHCRLVQAAVAARDGQIGFHVGNAENSYGQSIGGDTIVEAFGLPTLLLPFDVVDLIDMDVQGAELDVLASSKAVLDQKVRRIYIETHGQRVHASLLTLFRDLRWKPHFLYEGNVADGTPWGKINFQEGAQSWLNPRLHSADQLAGTQTIATLSAAEALRLPVSSWPKSLRWEPPGARP